MSSTNCSFMAVNLLERNEAVVASSSENSNYPLSNLQDPFRGRVFLFTGHDPEWITIDCTNIPAELLSLLRVEIINHNMTPEVVIKVQTHTSNSWGSPTNSVTIPVPAVDSITSDRSEERRVG